MIKLHLKFHDGLLDVLPLVLRYCPLTSVSMSSRVPLMSSDETFSSQAMSIVKTAGTFTRARNGLSGVSHPLISLSHFFRFWDSSALSRLAILSGSESKQDGCSHLCGMMHMKSRSDTKKESLGYHNPLQREGCGLLLITYYQYYRFSSSLPEQCYIAWYDLNAWYDS